MPGRGDCRGSRPEEWRMGGHSSDGPERETRGIAPRPGGNAARGHIREEAHMATRASGIRRIVVGVDGSEPSAAAVKWAVRLAKALGSQVIAVFAVDIPAYFPEPYGLPVQFDTEWRAAVQDEFESKWCKPLKRGGIRGRTPMEGGRGAARINTGADPEDAALGQGEASDGARIEQRLTELGQAIPDPSAVRISPWLRLQARFAPVMRMLAHMESNEQVEITDRYKRSTGDAETDAVLASIRSEEQGHSRSLDAIQATHATGDPPPSGAEGRLNRILGRETWHRTGSGWISGAIYGANDGLAAVFGIVAGVSGATGGSSFVLTAGLSGAVASALSMATGAFLAERSEAEVVAANAAHVVGRRPGDDCRRCHRRGCDLCTGPGAQSLRRLTPSDTQARLSP